MAIGDVRAVERFEATDGRVFRDRLDAVGHETRIDLARLLGSTDQPLLSRMLARAEEVAAVLTDYAAERGTRGEPESAERT